MQCSMGQLYEKEGANDIEQLIGAEFNYHKEVEKYHSWYKDTDGYEKGIIYVSGVFQPTLVAIAGNYQTADDMENNQSLKSLYGEDSSVIVSLNGRSLNYCHVKDVQTSQSRF